MLMRKSFLGVGVVLIVLGALLATPVHSAQVAFNVPLSLPKLQSLTTSIAATGGTVNASLVLAYDVKGNLLCSAGSTVDGSAVTCTGTEKSTASGWNFSFSVKGATTPKTTLTISGTGGANPITAKCVYNGPKGKANLTANQVTIVRSTPTANVTINAVTLLSGKMAGTGTIVSGYGNDTTPGAVKGSVSKTGKANWTLTQGKEKISFSGSGDSDQWIGTLTATLPPAKATVKEFSMTAIPIPPSGPATFKGTLSITSSDGSTPAEGVKVTLSSDRDGNGKIQGKETKWVETGSDGKFETTFDVVSGLPVIVKYGLDGYAAATKVYSSVTPGSTVTANGTFTQINDLNLSKQTARSDDGKLAISNLPANVTAIRGRVFNPNTESNQFPGEFADSTGARLVSSVFSTVQAQDAAGNPVKTLNGQTTIKMLVPQDTWGSIKDLTSGNGQIDVPLYYFDEDSGQWKRGPNNGWLVNSEGTKIPESSLGAIQGKTYNGSVYATGEIPHFSYWNVDWPVSTHTCISGRVVNGSGTPVAGATVSVKGISYTGSTSPQVTGADGTFCADAMRSEAPGEDIDGNGITGETHQVEITVSYQDQYYVFGPYNLPQTQASCGAGGCLDTGDLATTDAHKVTPTICTLNGKVVFSGTSSAGTSSLTAGDPIPGAWVYASDSDASDALNDCLIDPVTPCIPYAVTDSSGNFQVTAPVLTSLQVIAVQADYSGSDPHRSEFYDGQMSTQRCPGAPITVPADYWGMWFLSAPLLDAKNAEIGSVSVWNGTATVYFMVGSSTYYMAIVESGIPEITKWDGSVWFSADLQKYSTSGVTPAGKISLTVTARSADMKYSGAWSTTQGGFSGTWTEAQ